MTTTSRPFDSVKLVIWGPIPAWAGAANAAARAARASVSLLGTNLLSWDWMSPPRCTFRRQNASANVGCRNPNVDGARCRDGSRLLPALDPLLERRGLALVLRADPVRVVGRRGLIARGRRGHGLPRRLAGERRRFRLRGSKRRPYRTEYLFGLGAEIGGHHRARGLLGAHAGGLAVGAFLVAAAGLVELVGPQRPHLLFHRQVAFQFGFLGCQLLLAAGDVRIFRPSRGFRGDLGFVARRRQIAAGRHHQRRTLAVIDHCVAVASQPKVLHELAPEFAVERNVLLVGVLGACAAGAPRQRHGQREGRSRGGAPQPLRMSVPHSYPLQMTAECAVSPRAIVAKIRALLRHPCR